MKGMFPLKTYLYNKATPLTAAEDLPKTKVIMLLLDSWREDFVEMDPNATKQEPKLRDSSYEGKKVTIFNDLLLSEPENTILLPMRAELPTVTRVRAMGLMTGALNAYIDITNNFGTDLVEEDNVIY